MTTYNNSEDKTHDKSKNSSGDLSIFVWNDRKERLRAWCKCVEDAGFLSYSTDDTNIKQVIAEFASRFANLVLLDLLGGPKGEKLGYNIAKAIREIDDLVPIVIVTEEPAKLFGYDYTLGDLDVQNYYQANIMNHFPSFKDIVVRRNLSLWHQLMPDHLLVRLATSCLKDYKKGAKELRESIWDLPFSASIDTWHEGFAKKMSKFLKGLGFVELKSQFDKIADLFQTADRFYMAVGESRKHLSHNVQVFLLGLVFLCKYEKLRTAAIDSIREIFPDNKDEDELALIAIAVWGCAALTHDSAYLGQNLKAISNSILELAEKFRPAFKILPPSAELPDLKSWNWPKVHHGAIGAALWYNQIDEKSPSQEDKLIKLIANGIALHDSKIAGNDIEDMGLPYRKKKISLDSENWVSFLAMLADELQFWNREPNEKPSPFRYFTLDNLAVGKNGEETVFTLAFVARNHPPRLAERGGTKGTDEVEREMEFANKNLAANLDAGKTLEIRWDVFIEGNTRQPELDLLVL